MQIPNNNNQYYAYPPLPNQPVQSSPNIYQQPQISYNQQQQYPQYPQQMNQQYPQQYPIIQAQYVQPKPKPIKKPSPFSFEPGSDKDMDDAMKSIGNMYNIMFDSVDVQRERQKQEEQQEQVVMGVPIMQWNPYSDNKQL